MGIDMPAPGNALRIDIGGGLRPEWGIDMPAPGSARGERMLLGYAPEGGKRITAQQFRRICYPPAWSMRIYYPTNDEEPTPALPKGGSLNEAQYSLTSNRLSLPSLGVM